MFVLQNTPDVGVSLPELEITVEPLPEVAAKFDLTLSLGERTTPTGDPLGIDGALQYDADLFDRRTVEEMVARLERIMRQAVGNPSLPLHSFDLLSAAERQTLLMDWNATAKFIERKTLPQLLENQVARTPRSIALVFESDSLTYTELNEQANRLAHWLIARRIGPEKLVGICLERSFEMVVVVLAIVKCGAAYLPLDPDYPQARLAHMLADAAPELVVTTSVLRARLPHQDRVAVAEIDNLETKKLVAQSPASNLEDVDRIAPLLPHHPAYVIYTSGSTGAPKGVAIEHGGIASLAAFNFKALAIEQDSRILQFASLNFDASIWEMLMAFPHGAALVLLREHQRSGTPLRDVLVSQKITHVTLPPAVLPTLEGFENLPVKVLIVAGEACSGDLVARWSVGRRMLNAFGPTESTVLASISAPLSGSQIPPIGRPSWNTRVYVLDDHLQPAPMEAPGELYVAGLGLARGYLNRPALTSERFVPDPFNTVPGERMYRTGDLVRWNRHGILEYLGRVDQQIKIRGFRVETGEIEAALQALPGVAQAAVIARDGSALGKQLIAYVVPASGASLEKTALRSGLSERLPGYMVPASFVVLDALPRTPNGKVDRGRLPAPVESGSQQSTLAVPESQWEHVLADIWKQVLLRENVGVHDNFFDLGGHSLLLAQVHARIQSALGSGSPLPMVKLFEHPTVASLAAYLELREKPAVAGLQQARPLRNSSGEMAIIGMACRFPGAPSIPAFWENLRQGVESIAPLNKAQLAALPPELANHPNFVPFMGRLEDIQLFDAAFFGLNPAEATATDPQQRLLLECAWEVLESAGYTGEESRSDVGVFAGSGESHYRELLVADRSLTDALGEVQLVIGTGKDHVATRLSYLLNLRGPSVPVNTACSTSLVAVHLACQSLLNRECGMALAGGVSIADIRATGYVYQESSILSPDGHCRAFDASAAGTVPGSGVGLVLLKRLEDALADGDRIHAVIKGSAINNDGNAKVGYTAPGVEGQRQVIQRALVAAGVEPKQISYVEAHGTGTSLGDPIEVEALRQAFGPGLPEGSCALGSVKTNIGHCDSAAGVAGLIKTVLCLEHRVLIPSLHFEQPNPQLGLKQSPFYINTQTIAWPSFNQEPERHESPNRQRRFAGVSSFGIGGTNAHVVLGSWDQEVRTPEEETNQAPPSSSREWQLLTFSAHTESALASQQANLADFLKNHAETPLADVAFTLNTRRKGFSVREAFVCRDQDDLLASLASTPRKPRCLDLSTSPSVVFMFPGQGKAHADLGRDLYQKEKRFREEVDRCCHLLHPLLGLDLSRILFADDPESLRELHRPSLWQPALFVVEYALAQLWMSWGIKPSAMVGHSLGEYVAAALAGVFDLDVALLLVAERGRGTEKLEPGGMLAVPASEDVVRPYLQGRLSLAAVNAPQLCVVSGPVVEIDRLEQTLAALSPIRLESTHAFHSSLVDPLMQPLAQLASGFRLRAPRIPYLSNVTGGWIKDEEAVNPNYWARHLREPVLFASCLRELARKPGRILLEVGPGKVLSDLARRTFPEMHAITSFARGLPDDRAIAMAMAALWQEGIPVDWQEYYNGEKHRRVSLPTYPFERRRYWVESSEVQSSKAAIPQTTPSDALETKEPLESWLYSTTWKRSDRRSARSLEDSFGEKKAWLVLTPEAESAKGNEADFAAHIARRLLELGQPMVEVRAGASLTQHREGFFTINPRDPEDYVKLFDALRATGRLPSRIVYCSGANRNRASAQVSPDVVDFDSLIYLSQAIASLNEPIEGDGKIRLGIVSSNLHRVLDEPLHDPAKAAVLGIVHVLPKEVPAIVCQNVDLDCSEPLSEKLLNSVLAEFIAEGPENIVALRHGRRWVPVVDQLPVLPAGSTGRQYRLEADKVYLITHAFQEIGLSLAERLVLIHGARVALLDRAFFPQPKDWKDWIADQGESDPVSRKIARLQGIQGIDGINGIKDRLLVVTADPADRERMYEGRKIIESGMGMVAGVFHLDTPSRTQLIQGRSGSPSEILRYALSEAEVLKEVFAEAEQFVFFSSNLAEIGGIGQVEQAATGASLLGFAEQLAAQGRHALCIEWGTRGWQELGAGSSDRSPSDKSSPDKASFISQQLEEKRERFGMTVEECLTALDRAIETGLSNVVVSTRNFDALMAQQHLFTTDYFQSMMRESAGATSVEGTNGANGHSRPAVSTEYLAPRSEVEKLLVQTWERLFGFREIGVRDNFFELGGHSLLAVQVLKNLNETFSTRLGLKDLFEAPTVSALAVLISGKQPDEDEDQAALEQLLAEIEGLSPEKVKSELDAQSQPKDQHV